MVHEPPPNEPYMLIIRPNGTYKYQRLTEPPTIELLHEAGIEGPLEIVPYFNKLGLSRCVAFSDEEGKRKGLELNRAAQALWRLAVGGPIQDQLVGVIVIVVGKGAFLNG